MTKVAERVSTVAYAMVAMISLLAFPLMIPNLILVQSFPITNTALVSRLTGFCVSRSAKPLQGVRRRHCITAPFDASPPRKKWNTISNTIGNNKDVLLFLPFQHRRSLTNTALLLSQRRGLEVRTTGGATPTGKQKLGIFHLNNDFLKKRILSIFNKL
jgi:hypothetical protein